MGLIPSLTQPILGADGRLAQKQGEHPPVFLPLSDPEIPLTTKLITVNGSLLVCLALLMCVEALCVCMCTFFFCSCYFIKGVDSVQFS